jgi:hypothetical protein
MNDAVCLGCGCTDSTACPGGCYWLEVDYETGYGWCSARRSSRSAAIARNRTIRDRARRRYRISSAAGKEETR